MQLNDVYTFPQIHCTITKTKNSNHFMNEMYREKNRFLKQTSNAMDVRLHSTTCFSLLP